MSGRRCEGCFWRATNVRVDNDNTVTADATCLSCRRTLVDSIKATLASAQNLSKLPQNIRKERLQRAGQEAAQAVANKGNRKRK